MKMVGFQLQGGGEVVVEVASDSRYSDVVTRGGSGAAAQTVEKAEQSFDSALGAIHVMAEGVMSQLDALALPPEEARVEFGLEFNAKAGAVVASAGATAQLHVTLTWHSHG